MDAPAERRGSRARSRAAKLGAHRRRGMFGIPEWAVGVAFIMLAISIGKELQKRVGGSDDAQTRLDALEDVQRRLADVEERLDFAERMLAKQRDAERIG